MVLYEIVVEHEGTPHRVDFESDDGLEVLRFQLFSLTLIPPENQTIMDNSKMPIQSDAELLVKLSSTSGQRTFTLLEEASKGVVADTLAEMEKADEALARLLQEGNRNPSQEEVEHYILLQLLQWFKKSFRWINAAPCFLCGAETDGIGMGKPTSEDLQFGANRVELYRCRRCHAITRFPRYNDTRKLVETRSGRCGEWANCFTLYCRAFGYQTRLVLDFTDHVWTECFSKFLGRWIHLDPCEGALDKPLLYEQGWGKKLNYLIALSKDGVFDVTKRYTRKWEEVLLRRTITSEQGVANVIASLTARLRNTFSLEYLEQLRSQDKEEAAELRIFQGEHEGKLEALPGRLTGTTEWRKARGELGNSAVPLDSKSKTCPRRRACVDHHVSNVCNALGTLKTMCEKGSPVLTLRNTLQALLKLLKKLQKYPYKTRRLGLSLQSDDVLPLVTAIETDKLQPFFQALGLVQEKRDNEEVHVSSIMPVDTALALPVAIENIESMIDFTGKGEGATTLLERLEFLAENERLFGACTEASGEELPLGVASAAFDGLTSTKWEEPNGGKGGSLTYYLPSNSDAKVAFYELTSANDCRERDPKDWVLEGSSDGGCTWIILDKRDSQLFRGRFERKCYEILAESRIVCNAFRLRFLGIRDSSSQSRLQLSCVDLYKQKQLTQIL